MICISSPLFNMETTIRMRMESTYFCGYQVFGADNIVRFCKIILNLEPTMNVHGCAQIGISTSGQHIRCLTKKLLYYHANIGAKVLICIGTNDVINLSPIRNVKIQLRMLKRALWGKEVVFLTIPPLLKYWGDPHRMLKTAQYNREIKKLQGESFYVLDLYQFMLNRNGTPREELFEKSYNRPYHLQHPQEHACMHVYKCHDTCNYSCKCHDVFNHINEIGMVEIALWLNDQLPL